MNLDLTDYRILIVEDAEEYKKLISHAIGRSDRHLYVGTLAEARRELESRTFDCIILDLSLPDGNGLSLLSGFEELSCPILILTASQEIGTKVTGLSMGAQDYIVKPFEGLELAARVKNKIDFMENHGKVDRRTIGNLVIDLLKRRISFRDGSPVEELTRREFDCLVEFIDKIDVVLSRESLLDNVWGNENHVLERSVDSTIAGLRKKVKKWNHEIKAVYGVGYKLFRPAVQEIDLFDDPELFNIFVSESDTQLMRLDVAIGSKDWETVTSAVHKLKGTFAIYTHDLGELAHRIESAFRKEESIEGEALEFLNKARNHRTTLINERQQAA